jgi:hypothetical protein
MKRITLSLGALLALLIIAGVVWLARDGNGVSEKARQLQDVPTDQESQIISAKEMLPPYINLYGMPIASRLSDQTTYHLATTLPPSPGKLTVYEQSGDHSLGYEEARHWAALMGFSGGGYQEAVKRDDTTWSSPPFYLFFDGARGLSVSETGFSYSDEAVLYGEDPGALPVDEAIAMAEAFLRENGLLDVAYEAVASNGHQVAFRSAIAGRTLIYPQFEVWLDSSGRVVWVNHTPLGPSTAVADYPLRTAAEAWQIILSSDIDHVRSSFNLYPALDSAPPGPPAKQPSVPWFRTFVDGERVAFYSSLSGVYVPVLDGELPRIGVGFDALVEAPAEQLWALAEEWGKTLYLQGIYHQRRDGAALELVAWQPVEEPLFDFHTGTVRREGDLTILFSDEGESFVLVNAPADLPDGARIAAHSWRHPDGESDASFNWDRLALLEAILPRDAPGPEALPVNPEPIRQVTIHDVALVYHLVMLPETNAGLMPTLAVPLWRFKGETDTNEIIEIYVRAVTDEFIQDEDTFWNDLR